MIQNLLLHIDLSIAFVGDQFFENGDLVRGKFQVVRSFLVCETTSENPAMNSRESKKAMR